MGMVEGLRKRRRRMGMRVGDDDGLLNGMDVLAIFGRKCKKEEA